MKTRHMLTQAARALSRNRVRSFFMTVGIAVGITVLTVVLSAGMGAREQILDRVRVFGLENMMIRTGGATDQTRMGGTGDATANMSLEDAEAIRTEITSVREVAPFFQAGQLEIRWRDRSFTSRVFGVTPEWTDVWDWYVERGSFITHEDNESLARSAAIGPTVVRELFDGQNPLGETILVDGVPFEVTGVMLEKGTSAAGGDMDDRVFVPLRTYMRRVANVNYITGIRVQVRDLRYMEPAATDIAALLRDRHRLAPGTPDDFRITTPTEVTAMVEEMQGTFNLFLILVAGIALVVGGVVVANIMLISVSERRAEIGLRKAVGAKPRHIRAQFLAESVTVTLLGGAGGILLGIAGNFIVERLTGNPTLLTWQVLAIAILFSSAVGLVAGLYPARKAAAMPPADALRP